mgnify:CR=1 FL=1
MCTVIHISYILPSPPKSVRMDAGKSCSRVVGIILIKRKSHILIPKKERNVMDLERVLNRNGVT